MIGLWCSNLGGACGTIIQQNEDGTKTTTKRRAVSEEIQKKIINVGLARGETWGEKRERGGGQTFAET